MSSFGNALSTLLHSANSNAPSIPQDVTEFKNRLHERLFDVDLHIGEIKKSCRLTNCYISSRFRYYIGMTPSNYVVQQRLEAACILLEQSNLPVSDIAFEVGYKRPNSFTMAFKRYYGITPTLYRDLKCEGTNDVLGEPI